jgi:hypothetical protein
MLRHFERVEIHAVGTRGQIDIVYEWTRRWWQLGWGPDSTVKVACVGGDAAWEHDAGAALRATLARGGARIGPNAATGIGSGVGAVLGILLPLFLFVFGFVDETAAFIIWVVIYVPVVIAFGLAGTWVIPSLEIQERDQTNLVRTAKVAAAVIVGLIVAGLTKLLFKSQ